MFTYQKDTKSLFVAECGKKDFWREIRKSSTAFNIDTRRAILHAVEANNEEALQKWAEHTDFQKFMLKTIRDLKTKTGKEKWQKKPLDKKLLAWAEDLKKSLTAFQFCCYQFDEATVKTKDGKTKKGPRRVLKGCHLNGLVMLDIDHVDDPMEVWEKLQKCKALMARVVLVHITSSGHGIRIIFIADRQIGNLADNQISFAAVLGYSPDQSCIDATRNSFAPKEDEILFIDEERLFTYYDEEFDKEYTPMYRDKKTQPLHHEFTTSADQPLSEESGQAQEQGLSTPLSRREGMGESLWRGYDIQPIIDARFAEKLPCADDQNRHKESLKLATDLLLMLDGDKALVQRIVEAQTWVQEIIDERNENVAQTVESAASCIAEKEKKYTNCLPSKAMLTAIQEVTGKTYQEITKAQTQKAVTLKDDDMSRWLWDWGEQIEALMPEYPLLKDICKGLKRNQYPAAMFVAGGLLMTLMTRCTYRFYHRPEELRRLNNSTLIIGDPASGKSFATRLFKLLASPIVAADKVGKEAINAYREQMRTKGANKEKPKKPKVVVRVHPARTSNAQFIQDMVNSVENVDGEDMQLHMLTFDTELDNTVSVQKGGSWIDKFSMELKAFHNEEDGQAYSNNDSILQDFIVTWNFIYTGTPIALKKKVNEQNFGSGLATRLTCIPLPATNFEMMSRESTVDYDSDNRLKEWAEKLDKMKGELTVQKIVDELYDWTARRMADAAENDSKADEMLLKRCAYHGLNFSAPFIVMRHWDKMHQDGQYWCGEFETDEVDWKLAELIVNIQYACQRHYFGAMAEAYFDNKLRDANVNVQRKQKTFEGFERLPEEFTNEDVMRCFNLANTSSARGKVRRLIRDHLVEKIREERGTAPALYHKTGTILL
ncbi:BT4734/BF3469 family protein [uncultured Prevotella sp.]|uniref:BT4734/BF3469 family protein n=1 Tax=uncultured Prevotella sp. TaxID=159272 RepID=UPI00258330B3|nr:BT4734/BF3469 family protein [uncultured Prevotella sp.]